MTMPRQYRKSQPFGTSNTTLCLIPYKKRQKQYNRYCDVTLAAHISWKFCVSISVTAPSFEVLQIHLVRIHWSRSIKLKNKYFQNGYCGNQNNPWHSDGMIIDVVSSVNPYYQIILSVMSFPKANRDPELDWWWNKCRVANSKVLAVHHCSF